MSEECGSTTRHTCEAQYLTEENLETRRSVWHPTADGRDPTTRGPRRDRRRQPLRVLEVGPGTGMFAARLAAALPERPADGHRPVGALRGDDPRPRGRRPRGRRAGPAVRRRGLRRGRGAVDALPRARHRPGARRDPSGAAPGRAVRGRHQRRRAPRRPAPEAGGGTALVTGFSTQNGEEQLRAHFAEVRRIDLRPRAVFADSAVAEAYLESSGEDVDWRCRSSTSPASTPARRRSSAAADHDRSGQERQGRVSSSRGPA